MKRFAIIFLLALAALGCTRDEPEETEQAEDKGEILYYKHPMGLPDTSPVPKKDPMGMDYIPVYASDLAGAGADEGVAVSPEIIQTIGVRTTSIEMKDFGRTVRAFGAVEENTRLQTVVSARVEGWVDELAVTAVGDEVKTGDLLLRLYSPDLIAAQQDYLVAAKSGSAGRLASAARRLKSLGLQDRTIDALRKTGRIEERAPIYAEHDGVVAALDVREGGFVRPGNRIAMIQDYSTVWVIASLADQDLSEIAPGMQVMLDFPTIPADGRPGEIDYVYPTVDPKTRTGKARIVLDNNDGALRPGAYADVTVTLDGRPRLAVTSEAVLRDSRGAYVVRALGAGRFAPTPVKTGIVAMGLTEIISGAEAGDHVVASAQFLIDSESNLRESLHKMMDMDGDAPPVAAAGAHDHGGSLR
ncbi:MAG: efflux RND transporter periplasmic adaptor subunit [Parvularculaceae bacterium]